MKTRKIVIQLSAGRCDTDTAEFYEVNRDTTTDELDELAHNRALSHVESYGFIPEEWLDELEDEEIDEERIVTPIGWWEIYDPEIHDEYAYDSPPVFIKYQLE